MTIVYWAIGLVAAAIGLKLLIVWAEPYMAFVPRRGETPPPPGFQSTTISTSDGTKLTGWMTSIPSEGPVFLYFCGNAGNLSDREDLLRLAAFHGLAIVAFDYRGTGESQGRASEGVVNRDAGEIYEFVLNSLNVDSSRVILWGHSIGGAIATELGRRHPPAGIVLEGTFRSARVMAKRMLPFLPVKWLMTYKFDNEENVSRLECPFLFIHGSRDFTIPVSDSEQLHKLARSEKELWIVDGADHNDVYVVAADAYFTRLLQFGQRVVGTPATVN